MAGTQFPGFVPLQFAQGPDLATALQGLGKAGSPLAKGIGQTMNAPPAAAPPGAPVAGAQGPSSVGSPTAGPMPFQPAPAPTLLDALRNMSPGQVMASLQRVSQPPQPGMVPPQQPQMQPGSAIFQGAGMADPSTFGG